MSAETSGKKWNKRSKTDFTVGKVYIFGKKWTNHSALSKQESEHFEELWEISRWCGLSTSTETIKLLQKAINEFCGKDVSLA